MKLAEKSLKPVQKEIVLDPLASFFKNIKVFMNYGFDGDAHMTLVERHDGSTSLNKYSLSEEMKCEINREIILPIRKLAVHGTCQKPVGHKIHIRRYHEIYKMHQIQKIDRDYVRLKLTVPINVCTKDSEMEISKQDLHLAEDLVYEKIPGIIQEFYPVYEKAYIEQIQSVWDTLVSVIGIDCEKLCYVIRQSLIKDISYDKFKGEVRIKPDLGYELDQLRINNLTELDKLKTSHLTVFDSVDKLLNYLCISDPYRTGNLTVKLEYDESEKPDKVVVQSQQDDDVEIVDTGIIVDPADIIFEDGSFISDDILGKRCLNWTGAGDDTQSQLNRLADRVILDRKITIDSIKEYYGDKLNENNMRYSVIRYNEIERKEVSHGLAASDLAIMLDAVNQLNVLIYGRLCEILPIAMVDIIERKSLTVAHASVCNGSTTMFRLYADSDDQDEKSGHNIRRQVKGREILKTMSHLYNLTGVRTDQRPDVETVEKEETVTDESVSEEPKQNDCNASLPPVIQLDVDPLQVLLIAYPDLNMYDNLSEEIITGNIPDEWSYRVSHALSTIRPTAWDNLQKFAEVYFNLKDKTGIKSRCVFHHANEIVIKNKSNKRYTQDTDITGPIKLLVNAMACYIYELFSKSIPIEEVVEAKDGKRTYVITISSTDIPCIVYKNDEFVSKEKILTKSPSISGLFSPISGLMSLYAFDNFTYNEINETEQSVNSSKTESKEITGSLREIVSRISTTTPSEEIDTEEKTEAETETLVEEIPSDQFEQSDYCAIIHIDPYMILEHLCPLTEGYQKFMDGTSDIDSEKIRHYLIENYVQSEISEIAKKPTAYMITHFKSIAVETFNHPTTRSSSRFLIPMINKITGIIYDTLSKSSKNSHVYAEYINADRDNVLHEEMVSSIRRMMRKEDCEYFYDGSEEFYIIDPELETYCFTINPLQVLLVAYPDLASYVDLETEIVKKGMGFDKTKVCDALDVLYPGTLNYLQMFLVGCRRMHYDDPLKVTCRIMTAKEIVLSGIKDTQFPSRYLDLPKDLPEEERISKSSLLLTIMMKSLVNKMAVCIYDLLNETVTINEILKYHYKRLTYDLSGDLVSCSAGKQLPDVSTIVPSQLHHLYHLSVIVPAQNLDGNKPDISVIESPCRINTPLDKEESPEELDESDCEDEESDSEEEDTGDQSISFEYDPVEILWNSICRNFRIGVVGETKYLILDRSTIYEQFCSDEHVKNNSKFMEYMKERRQEVLYITATELNNSDTSRIRELLEKIITSEETYLQNSIDISDKIENDVIISLGSDDEIQDGNSYTERIVAEFKRLLFTIIKTHIPTNVHLTKKEEIMKCNENETRPVIEVGYDSLEIFMDVMVDVFQYYKTSVYLRDWTNLYGEIKKAFFDLIGEDTSTDDLYLNPVEFKNNSEKKLNIWKYFIYSDMVSGCEEFISYRKTMEPDYEGHPLFRLYDDVVFKDTLTEESWENRTKRYMEIIDKYSPVIPYLPSYWDDLYAILRKRLVYTVLPEIFTQIENSKDSSESEE